MVMSDTHKKCRVCGEVKPLSSFHINKQCKLGVTGTCRKCTGKRLKNWYKINRGKRQEAANKRNRERKLEMIKHYGGRCHDCGGKFPPCVFDFHHIDPATKDFNPSKALSYKAERMQKEFNKCIMLCANCHRIRHFNEDKPLI